MVKNNVAVITQLRGIAALLVFLFHFVCVSNNFINSKELQSIFDFGRYGVQFFFVISGFVITYSMISGNYQLKNIGTFLAKRITRVEPPYLIVLLATVILLYVKSRLGMGANEPIPPVPQILLHLGYLIPFSNYEWLNIVFWTLAIEFQFYLLFSLLFVPLITSPWWLRGIIIYACMLLCWFTTHTQTFFYWSPVFFLGITICLYKKQKISFVEFSIHALAITLMIFIKLGWQVGIFSIIPSLIIYFEPVIKSKILTFLGDISYSLYLIHTLVAFTIINLAFKYTTGTYARIEMGVLAFVTTFVVAYILYLFIEKPFKKIASKLSYR